MAAHDFMPGSVQYGFTALSSTYVQEVAADCWLLRHDKSGARLLFVDRPDPNRVFGIAFRTPPRDSAGEAHIIEHCVLNGSRKYRSREPFMDMAKGSLATFLNAMTFPDKTVYPVASRNLTDFHNLMDVYLDAVFYPSIYEEENIFRQEGWRLELEDAAGPLQRNGVVYNEMKGSYSDPHTILFQAVMAGLLPDTPYVHESGGNPQFIPGLTYDDFLDFHRSCYHPSNSWIFLYGDLDLRRELEYLNREYLSQFDRETPVAAIPLQRAPAAPAGIEQKSYPLGPDEDPANRHYLAYSFVTGGFDTPEDNLMLQIAQNVLFFSQAAPVRRALVGAGLAEDLTSLMFSGRQTMGGVAAINAREDAVQEIPRIIEEAIRADLARGIDEDRLLAPLNQIEYALRGDEQATRGLVYFLRSMQTALYEGDSLDGLLYQDSLDRVRRRLTGAYFAEWTEEHILDNPHKYLLHLVPTPGLSERQAAADEAQLAAGLDAMDDDERAELIDETRRFKAWQQQQETPEQLATIPRMALSDVSMELNPAGEDSLHHCHGATLLRHTDFTAGIHYLTFSFEVDHIATEDLALAGLLANLYGKVDTARHSYGSLDTAVRLGTGGISTSLDVSQSALPDEPPHLRFTVQCRAVDRELDTLVSLLGEILLESDFSSTERLRELVTTMRTRYENDITSDGLSYANNLAAASFRESAWLRDRIEGIAFYDALRVFERELSTGEVPEGQDPLPERLAQLSGRLLARRGLVVLTTSDRDGQQRLNEYCEAFLDAIPLENLPAADRQFKPHESSLAIRTPGQVQYVCQGFDYIKAGGTYSGLLPLAARLLSNPWLHQRIRAQGGAYGAGLSLGRSGSGTAWSYRDPHVERTLDVYRGMGGALSGLTLSDEELVTAIIGTVNAFDPARTPQAEGRYALHLLLTDQTREDINRAYRELLAAQQEDLRALGPVLDKALRQKHICVIGSAAELDKAQGRFDHMRNLNL